MSEVTVIRINSSKKRRVSIPSPVYKNRFEVLSGTQEESTSEKKKENPPLVFLYGVENYQEMRQFIEKSQIEMSTLTKLYEVNKP